jgi:Nif-specific regulatory protein
MKPALSISPIGLIIDINDQFSRSEDVRSNIRNALEVLSRGVCASYAFYAEVKDNGELGLAESYGLGLSDFRRLEANINAESFRNAIGNKKLTRIDPEDFKELENETATDAPFLSIAPARAGNGILGIVGLGFESGSSDHSQLLALFGSMVAQVLRIERGIRGERERLREENIHLKQELKEKYNFSHIVGNSNAMKLVYEQITQVAKSNATVLLRAKAVPARK